MASLAVCLQRRKGPPSAGRRIEKLAERSREERRGLCSTGDIETEFLMPPNSRSDLSRASIYPLDILVARICDSNQGCSNLSPVDTGAGKGSAGEGPARCTAPLAWTHSFQQPPPWS